MARINKEIVISAIIVIGTIEIFALSNGINGIILTTVIGVIAGLAGWSLPQLKLNVRRKHGR